MVSKMVGQNASQAVRPAYWVALVLTYLLMPLVLMACGWDLRWWQAWTYSLLVFACGVGARISAERRHPGLMVERTSLATTRDAKPWDRVLSPLMSLSVSFPLAIVAGLDHRFGWSPPFALWLNALGIALIVAGYTLAGWALIVNRFFSSFVRIQTDRGHLVCDSGPYRIMRHPGYSGNILALPGIVLALSSVWTSIPAAVAVVIAATRTVLEDRTLQNELPGYRDYAERVHCRLIPGVF